MVSRQERSSWFFPDVFWPHTHSEPCCCLYSDCLSYCLYLISELQENSLLALLSSVSVLNRVQNVDCVSNNIVMHVLADCHHMCKYCFCAMCWDVIVCGSGIWFQSSWHTQLFVNSLFVESNIDRILGGFSGNRGPFCKWLLFDWGVMLHFQLLCGWTLTAPPK